MALILLVSMLNPAVRGPRETHSLRNCDDAVAAVQKIPNATSKYCKVELTKDMLKNDEIAHVF